MKAAPVLIVILNWNGWCDTKECLGSLTQLTNVDFVIAVIDNGSDSDCIEIEHYGLKRFDRFTTYSKEEIKQTLPLPVPPLGSLVLIKNNDNLGFARANNIGIEYAKLTGFGCVFMLNNDTIVEPGSLHSLMEVLQTAGYCAVVPQIRYYDKPDTIWCCGGEINNFYESYHYKNEKTGVLPDIGVMDITFATGCALLFKVNEVTRLTEKFFFGEEDFELALRMKAQGKKMACVLNAIIYHKENASIDRSARFLNKIYLHKLNRFIDIKHFAPLRWPFIVIYRSFKFFLLMLLVEKRSLNKALRFGAMICYQGFTLHEVNKKTFFEVLNYDLS